MEDITEIKGLGTGEHIPKKKRKRKKRKIKTRK